MAMSHPPKTRYEQEDPEVALMLAVKEGSDEAFIALIRQYQTPLVNFFHRMGAYHDSEDLTQETFLRIYDYRKKYKPRARFKTFLYLIARHVWADRCRKEGSRSRTLSWLRLDAEIRAQIPRSRDKAKRLAVREALATLSPKLKEVIILNVYQGYRYQEIADMLNIPLGTVKSRMHLAMKAMRNSLDDYGA